MNIASRDRIDRKILDRLQQTGRISMTDLALEVGLSTTACTERVKRMERDGTITGYHAHLGAEAMGKPLLVFVEIKLTAKSDDVFDKVARELKLLPDVQECHLVSGSFDYLLKARLGSMKEYRRLLGDILKKMPVAAESNSYVVMEEIKEGLEFRLDR